MTDCPYSNRRQLLWWSANRADTENGSQVFWHNLFIRLSVLQDIHPYLVCQDRLFWAPPFQSSHFTLWVNLHCTGSSRVGMFSAAREHQRLKPSLMRGHVPCVIIGYVVDDQQRELSTCNSPPPPPVPTVTMCAATFAASILIIMTIQNKQTRREQE